MSNTTYLAVHPCSFVDGRDIYDDQPAYTNLRKTRLTNPSLRQVLLVEEVDLELTLEKFSLDLNRWKDRIFFTKFCGFGSRTSEDSIALQRSKVRKYGSSDSISWQALTTLITQQYPARSYSIWGAELHLHNEKVTGGCVNLVYNYLKLPNQAIDRKACWKEGGE